jgi:hypothetical protein
LDSFPIFPPEDTENEGAAMTERGNEILAALPDAAMAALQPHLTPVTFAPGNAVQQVGELIDHVSFPTVGIASLQIIMSDGRAVDTVMVGHESVLGPMAAFGVHRSPVRCVARTTLVAHRISAVDLMRQAAKHESISRSCISMTRCFLSRGLPSRVFTL